MHNCDNFAHFPEFDIITSQPGYALLNSVRVSIIEHLQTLKDNFDGYFGGDLVHDVWVRSPFTVSLDRINDDDVVKDELIDLRSNERLRIDFEALDLSQF